MIQRERTKSQQKMTSYDHKGYDFSGAAGHDILVMDSLMSRMQSAILEHIAKGPDLFGLNEMGG